MSSEGRSFAGADGKSLVRDHHDKDDDYGRG